MTYTLHLLDEEYKEMVNQTFSKIPFYTDLKGCIGDEDIRARFRRMCIGFRFFARVYQDMLKNTYIQVNDMEIKRCLQQQAEEESGHELWLDMDLVTLRVEPFDIWQNELLGIRQAVYRYTNIMLQASSDEEKLVATIMNESTAEFTFTKFVECTSKAKGFELKYFGKTHLEAELCHEFLSKELAERMYSEDRYNQLKEFGRKVMMGIVDVILAISDYMRCYFSTLYPHPTCTPPSLMLMLRGWVRSLWGNLFVDKGFFVADKEEHRSLEGEERSGG